VLRHGCIS